MRRLVGKPVQYFLRTTDILCIGIGEEVEILSKRLKESRKVTEYVLHVQSSWRFRKDNHIILASDDFYRPYYRELEDTEWRWENLNRTNEGSLFDENAKSVNKEIFPLTVTDIVTSSAGDLMLQLSDGYYFDLFINGSRHREFYRILDFRSGNHTTFLEKTSVSQ